MGNKMATSDAASTSVSVHVPLFHGQHEEEEVTAEFEVNKGPAISALPELQEGGNTFLVCIKSTDTGRLDREAWALFAEATLKQLLAQLRRLPRNIRGKRLSCASNCF